MLSPGNCVKVSPATKIDSLTEIRRLPPCKQRSLGDGMEAPKLSDQINPQHNIENTARTPLEPTIDQQIPMPVKPHKSHKNIPHEPYKAAVLPLSVPKTKKSTKKRSPKTQSIPSEVGKGPALKEAHIVFPLYSSQDLEKESLPLVKVVRHQEGVSSIDSSLSTAPEESSTCTHCEEEKQALQEEIQNLKEENKKLQEQFLVQTQVNGEIKKLLVASLGEDIQARVQFLSEDKAALAQHVAHYSQKLAEEHEETERLAIQSDVWRSKFLASSLMVDELAGWKAKLMRKYEDALEAITLLLEEHQDVRLNLIAAQRKLRNVQDAFDPMAKKHHTAMSGPQNCTLLTLAQGLHRLGDDLRSRLLPCSGSLSPGSSSTSEWTLGQLWTPAEQRAKEVLASKDIPSNSKEHAAAAGGWKNSSTLHHPPKFCPFHSCINSPSVTGCRHCSGVMKVV